MGDLDTFNGMHKYLNLSALILSYLTILFITPEWEILYSTVFIWKLELLGGNFSDCDLVFKKKWNKICQ